MTDTASMTRDQLIALRDKFQRRRGELTVAIQGLSGKLPGVAAKQAEIVKLKAICATLDARISVQTESPGVGRMYAYLKKVIKHELGEATLAGYIAEAERLSEADAAAAAVEGY